MTVRHKVVFGRDSSSLAVVRMTLFLSFRSVSEESRVTAVLVGDSSLYVVPFRMTIPFEEKAVMTIMSFRSVNEESHVKYILRFFTTIHFVWNYGMIMSFRARAIARRGIP